MLRPTILALVVAATLASCSDDGGDPQPVPEPTFVRGAEAKKPVDGLQIAISDVTTDADAAMFPVNPRNSLIHGRHWLLVDMAVTNTSDTESHDLSDLTCVLDGGNGQTFQELGVTPFEASSLSQVIPPLGTVSDWQCSFIVPSGQITEDAALTVSGADDAVTLPLFLS